PHRRLLVRRLRPAVHAPPLPGGAGGRRGQAPLPVPQRLVRSGHRPAAGGTAAAAAAARPARGAGRHRVRHRRRGAHVSRPPRFSRSQRMTIVNGILLFVVLIVILQLWLLTATMNAYLGGDTAILVPAALASLACLALNLGLLRYLVKLE